MAATSPKYGFAVSAIAALAAFAMRRRLHNADIRSTEYADV